MIYWVRFFHVFALENNAKFHIVQQDINIPLIPAYLLVFYFPNRPIKLINNHHYSCQNLCQSIYLDNQK